MRVLVEAESFTDTGGWIVDQQFMDRMGSPYLLAHGMGIPVDDATTTVKFPAPGRYRVYVRTKDWVGPWKTPGAPGRFQLLIDGTPLDTVFGTEGADWHWQDGGMVAVEKTEARLSLHDMTGLEGRCDAVLFTDESDGVPPDAGPELVAFRREALGIPDTPPDAGRYDLVVVGGGIAGVCAAVSATRLGLKVALVQDRPVLGGNASPEARVHVGGETNLPPYPNLGSIVGEIGLAGSYPLPMSRYAEKPILRVAAAEKTLDLFLDMHVVAVEVEGRRIGAVIARNIVTGEGLRFPAELFADCTGDGCVGFLAGADFRYGREGRDETDEPSAPETADGMTLGSTVFWEAAPGDEPADFPQCPWAVENRQGNATQGNWNWEAGFFNDTVADAEIIRDYAFRVIYGHWSSLKNDPEVRDEYAAWKLSWMGFIGAKRESRRLLGDVILNEMDIVERRAYPDACVTTTWPIDLHYPANAEEFSEGGFRSRANMEKIEPYPIPYRCLYSRSIDNLFMAGRRISATHVAFGTTRVMGTCGMMGEVVGMAASICAARVTTPRGVYRDHLDELKQLLTNGVGRTG